jgi:hypothetical protein
VVKERIGGVGVPRCNSITLVPLVLGVERIGESEEHVWVVGKGVFGFETATDDGNLVEMLVLH